MGYPRNRTWSPVEIPLAPAKTCKETVSPSSLITFASDSPCEDVTIARSLLRTPSAFTDMTFPAIDSIFVYTFCISYHLPHLENLGCPALIADKPLGDQIFDLPQIHIEPLIVPCRIVPVDEFLPDFIDKRAGGLLVL